MKRDTQIFDLIAAERSRQMHGIELIASENYASPRVMQAQGTVLTNKYAEGYPGKRYYGGCEQADIVERQHVRAHQVEDEKHLRMRMSKVSGQVAVSLSGDSVDVWQDQPIC